MERNEELEKEKDERRREVCENDEKRGKDRRMKEKRKASRVSIARVGGRWKWGRKSVWKVNSEEAREQKMEANEGMQRVKKKGR